MTHRFPQPGKSLGDIHPELTLFWSSKNELTPFEYCKSSKEKVWWKCSKGIHEDYPATCDSRGSGKGCPKCAHIGKPPFNESLAYLYPNIASTWSPKNDCTPFEVWPSSHYKALWVCKKHGEYYTRCSYRLYNKGCNKCKRHKISLANSIPNMGRSLSDARPDLVRYYSSKNKIPPTKISVCSNKQDVYWICPQGHEEYKMSCNQRSLAKIGCKICRENDCSIRKSRPLPFHSFADLYPSLLKEYSSENTRNPYSLNPGADYMAKWVCKKGHEWSTRVYQRTRANGAGSNCPICSKFILSNIEKNIRICLLGPESEDLIYRIGKWSVDIYFPESRTIIEYDGSRWHHKPENYERDRRKSLDLTSQGYKIIRIREISTGFQLDSLNVKDPNYHEIFYKNGYHKKYSSEPTEELLISLQAVL